LIIKKEIKKTLKKNDLEELIDLRHELHRNPELSFKEVHTAAKVVRLLKDCGADPIIQKIGGHGVLAQFNGHAPGPCVLLRAELDALPIPEENKFDYSSQNPGNSHACGHDGHMTILIGVAKWIAENPLKRGSLFLLFQSAEETGEGAKAILEDAKWKAINPDFVFALHNLPGHNMNLVLVKNNHFTASVKSLIIRLNGKTAHAGQPETGYNPAWAMAEIINLAKSLTVSDKNRDDFMLITPVHMNLGEKAYGVSAGYGELHFTLRSWDPAILEKICEQLLEKVAEIAISNNLSHNSESLQAFRATINDSSAVDIIRNAAIKTNLEIKELEMPFSWGEDFGLFTERYKGAMFVLGAGKHSPALHNPDYDFQDELLISGINMFKIIIKNMLK
jgi:amidohydrolase